VIPLNYGPPTTLDTRSAKEQQDAKRLYRPSLVGILFVIVLLIGVAVWALLH